METAIPGDPKAKARAAEEKETMSSLNSQITL